MGHNILLIAAKERERAAMLRLAGEIVEVAGKRGRALSPGEDAIAVQLVKKAQALEREINRLQGDRQSATPKNSLTRAMPK
jgi:hypothetical protein